MRLDRAASIDDLRRLARRRLPRLVFDFIEGGHGDENCLKRNRRAFAAIRLVPRYLVDVANRDQSVPLFGRRYASPFGIGPTGMAGLIRPGADHHLATAAAEADIPFVLSGGGNGPIEELAAIAGNRLWYQVYGARDPRLTERMIARARDAGVEVLMVTVDVPVSRKSDRDIRNGFIRPYRPTPSAFLEALWHPAWIAGYLRHGLPKFDSWAPFAPPGSTPRQIAAYLSTQHPATQTIREVEAYRKLWPGKLVVKGILHPDDARNAADAGADGLVISNHGGRGLDHAPATIEVLPAIRVAASNHMTLILDSGIRRGADVLVALSLGADFVLFGRPTLYGVAAAGLEGARRALSILRQEVDLGLGQIGCASMKDLSAERLTLPVPCAVTG